MNAPMKKLGGQFDAPAYLAYYLHKSGHPTCVIGNVNTKFLKINRLKTITFLMASFPKLILHDFDVIHVHFTQYLVPTLVKKRAKKILSTQGNFVEGMYRDYGKLLGRVAGSFEKFIYKFIDGVIIESDEEARICQKYGVKYKYIPKLYPTNPSFYPSEAEFLHENQIIYAGRLFRIKGPDILINAMQHVDANCIICGTGPEEMNLKRLTKKIGVSGKVHFLGFQNWDRLIKLI
ncbi:MAG: glycosyltransferase, partial [Candidatus Helarchaeota archaeon]